MKLPMTPSRKTQSRWAAEVAHVARLALAGQGIRETDTVPLSLSGMRVLREGLRACMEGRLRLAVMCFVAAYAGDVFVAARRADYRALPTSPEQARKQFASGLGLENLGMARTARATAFREDVELYQSGPEVVA